MVQINEVWCISIAISQHHKSWSELIEVGDKPPLLNYITFMVELGF